MEAKCLPRVSGFRQKDGTLIGCAHFNSEQCNFLLDDIPHLRDRRSTLVRAPWLYRFQQENKNAGTQQFSAYAPHHPCATHASQLHALQATWPDVDRNISRHGHIRHFGQHSRYLLRRTAGASSHGRRGRRAGNRHSICTTRQFASALERMRAALATHCTQAAPATAVATVMVGPLAATPAIQCSRAWAWSLLRACVFRLTWPPCFSIQLAAQSRLQLQ